MEMWSTSARKAPFRLAAVSSLVIGAPAGEQGSIPRSKAGAHHRRLQGAAGASFSSLAFRIRLFITFLV